MIRRVLVCKRLRTQNINFTAVRWMSDSVDKPEGGASTGNSVHDQLDAIMARDGHKKLYYGNQAMTLRIMLGVAGVNFLVGFFCLWLICLTWL